MSVETIWFHLASCSLKTLAEQVEHLIRLLRWRSFRAAHDAAQRDQIVVQPDREIEHVLTALRLGLDEHFFDRRHLLVQRLAGIDDGLLLGIVAEPLIESH